jgi:hypothetical protein
MLVVAIETPSVQDVKEVVWGPRWNLDARGQDSDLSRGYSTHKMGKGVASQELHLGHCLSLRTRTRKTRKGDRVVP